MCLKYWFQLCTEALCNLLHAFMIWMLLFLCSINFNIFKRIGTTKWQRRMYKIAAQCQAFCGTMNHHHWASLNLISERNCFMFQFMLIMFIIMFPSHSCFESNYSQLNFKQIIKFLNNLNILTCWMMWILLTHWTWPLFSVETQRKIIKNIIILIYKNLHGDDYLIFNSSSHCL